MQESNIEKLIIEYLNQELPAGWSASGEIPEHKPEKFVVVERTGGAANHVVIEEPQITIGFYHRSSQLEAGDVAIAMDKKIREDLVARYDHVSRVHRNALTRLDDNLIKYRRYLGYYNMIFHI